MNNKPILYYINKKNLNSNKLIIIYINKIFRLKYNSIIFYVYNLDKFNIVFIIRALLKYNKINNSNNLIIKEVKYNKTNKKI